MTAVLNPPAITKYINSSYSSLLHINTTSSSSTPPFHFLFSSSSSSSFTKLTLCAAKKKHPHQISELITHKLDAVKNIHLQDKEDNDDLGWLPSFPHVLTASMSNFLFGYHIGVMNGPILSIAQELGFEGNTILEGLVVSIFIAGAFLGGLISSSLVDKLGCRHTLQVATIPLIVGAILSAQSHGLDELLLGRFLVGLGIGVNTVLVSIYISEVSPTKYRGSLGSLCQIGTCTGIILSLFLGTFSDHDSN